MVLIKSCFTIQEVTVILGNSFTLRALGSDITINEEEQNITRDDGFVDRVEATKLVRHGDNFALDFGDLRVKWTADGLTVMVTIDHGSPLRNNARGLCGNINDDPHGSYVVSILQ